MHIRLRLNRQSLCRWHEALLAALASRPGVTVDLEVQAGAAPLPAGASLLFQLEALIHGLPRPGPASALAAGFDLDRMIARPGAAPDLVIDLDEASGDAPVRTWQVTYDGVPGQAALLAALLAGRSPVAEVREDGRTIAAGRLGTEYNGVSLASFEDGLSRTTTLLVSALEGGPAAGPAVLDDGAQAAAPAFGAAELGKRAVRQLAWAILRRLYRLCYDGPHWRVGWRTLGGPDLIALREHPAGGWTDLADDGHRFYADPFPVAHDERLTLFVEDFPHRTGKGLISAMPFGPGGPLGPAVPVLECPYHLSYPFVFEAAGAWWMVPESCAAGTIDLFRATRFPGGWVKEATLVADVTASDATLVAHGGRWWMFATVKAGGGSFSDALHLWSAPDFRGPWTPHARNPVLIDIAAARPAGRIVSRDGDLWRPVQDCRRGYGAALGLARILQLDDAGFDQRVEAVLTPGPAWPGRRIHTLNTAGPLEFIDGSAPGPRKILRSPAAGR